MKGEEGCESCGEVAVVRWGGGVGPRIPYGGSGRGSE